MSGEFEFYPAPGLEEAITPPVLELITDPPGDELQLGELILRAGDAVLKKIHQIPNLIPGSKQEIVATTSVPADYFPHSLKVPELPEDRSVVFRETRSPWPLKTAVCTVTSENHQDFENITVFAEIRGQIPLGGIEYQSMDVSEEFGNVPLSKVVGSSLAWAAAARQMYNFKKSEELNALHRMGYKPAQNIWRHPETGELVMNPTPWND